MRLEPDCSGARRYSYILVVTTYKKTTYISTNLISNSFVMSNKNKKQLNNTGVWRKKTCHRSWTTS